jgi:hypothetical protein
VGLIDITRRTVAELIRGKPNRRGEVAGDNGERSAGRRPRRVDERDTRSVQDAASAPNPARAAEEID